MNEEAKKVENENTHEYRKRAFKAEHPLGQLKPVDDDIYESVFFAQIKKIECRKLRKGYYRKLDLLARIATPFYDEAGEGGKSLRSMRSAHSARVRSAQNPFFTSVLGPAVGYGDFDVFWLVLWDANIFGRLESCSITRKNFPKQLEREIYELTVTPKDS